TMYSGSCPRPCPFRDVTPRSSTDGCAPGRPLLETMLAPGTLPWIWVRALAAGTGIWDASMRDTANGTVAAPVACCTPGTTPLAAVGRAETAEIFSRLRANGMTAIRARWVADIIFIRRDSYDVKAPPRPLPAPFSNLYYGRDSPGVAMPLFAARMLPALG